MKTTALCALLLLPAALVLTGQTAGRTSAPTEAGSNNSWWKNAIIYEIYPRSFGDSNGDGTGDLKGITAHLDYLKELGADAIWLTPFYPSPQVDFGYDISDYRNVDPRYGTLADFDRMVAEAKKRNIRVLIDMVLNHTSDQHPWFRESRASATGPKADWYVWSKGKPGPQPPNNWTSSFGGSAWQWVPERGEYYFHHYYTEQPDLNWRNPKVREAVFDILRFWQTHGVAGFRLDGIGNLYEDAELRDEPVLPGVNALGDPNLTHIYTHGLPETDDAYRMLRKVSDEFPDMVLVGQVSATNIDDLARAYGNNDRLHLPIDAQFGTARKVSAAEFRVRLLDAETRLNGKPPLLVLDSHDRPRSWTRYGDGAHDVAIAKLVATLLLAPKGAALIYYGQELGIENNDPRRREDVQDPVGRRGWPENKGRDGERTPMHWTAGPNAGFSKGKTTWLPLAPSYRERNVATEAASPDSLLSYYKALIRLRKRNPALRDGAFEPVSGTNEDVLAWLSRTSTGTAVVVLNCSASPQTVAIDARLNGLRSTSAITLLDSSGKTGESVVLNKLVLPPYGAFVGQVN